MNVVAEQEAPDGDFPTVTAPNPEDPAAFKYAIPLAEQVGATVVFGTDPDCDRMGVAVRDGQGTFHTLTGNQIGCLLLYHVLSQRQAHGTLPRNGAICKSIVSTEMARAIAASFDIACIDTLTGFKFIGEKIQCTTSTMVRRMETKGLIRHETQGKAKVFSPAVSREQAALAETRSLLDKAFDGSVGLLVNTLIRDESISRDELDELYALLRQAEEQEGSK